MTKQPRNSHLSKEQYARLRTEVNAPYRGLRHFIYLACAVSGLMGGFIFLTRLLAGGDVTEIGADLALQVGVVALMIWLWRIDRPRSSN